MGGREGGWVGGEWGPGQTRTQGWGRGEEGGGGGSGGSGESDGSGESGEELRRYSVSRGLV